MQFNVTSVEQLTHVVEFHITKEEFEKVYNAQLQRLSQDKSFRLSGFRPGKIPLQVVEKYRGKEAEDSTIRSLVDKATKSYAATLDVLLSVIVSIEPAFNTSSANSFLVIKVTYEALPKFELKDFSDVELAKPAINLEEAVEEMVLALRTQRSKYISTDAPAEIDSLVKFTSLAKDSLGNEYAALTVKEDQTFVVGSYDYPKNFSAAFVGRKKGDKFTFDYFVDPDDLSSEKYTIDVEIKEVSVRELPEVDDEFVSLFLQRQASLDELKEEIKRNITREIKLNTVRYLLPQINAAILEKYKDLEIPTHTVQQSYFEQLRLVAKDLKEQSEKFNKDPIDLAAELSKLSRSEYEQAIFNNERAKFIISFVRKEIIDHFGITVSDQEVSGFIDDMSVMFEYPQGYKEEILKDKKALNQYYGEILFDKFANKFADLAKVVDQPLSYIELVRKVTSEMY